MFPHIVASYWKSQGLMALIYDPLMVGIWGVLIQLFAAGIASLLLHHGAPLGGPLYASAVGTGLGLSVLSAFMLFRTITSMWAKAVALRGLPGPKYNVIVGQLKELSKSDPHRWAKEVADEYGPIVKCRVMFFFVVMITDPALAMHILYSPHFDKFRFNYSFLEQLLGGTNILTGPTDEHWKAVRKGVAPAFSTSQMRGALQLVVKRSNQLVEYLTNAGSEKPQNIDRLLLSESMDVIGEFGFQKETNALNSLSEPPDKYEKGLSDVDVILGATREVEDRLSGPHRQFMLWKKELWDGAYLLKRYRVYLHSSAY